MTKIPDDELQEAYREFNKIAQERASQREAYLDHGGLEPDLFEALKQAAKADEIDIDDGYTQAQNALAIKEHGFVRVFKKLGSKTFIFGDAHFAITKPRDVKVISVLLRHRNGIVDLPLLIRLGFFDAGNMTNLSKRRGAYRRTLGFFRGINREASTPLTIFSETSDGEGGIQLRPDLIVEDAHQRLLTYGFGEAQDTSD